MTPFNRTDLEQLLELSKLYTYYEVKATSWGMCEFRIDNRTILIDSFRNAAMHYNMDFRLDHLMDEFDIMMRASYLRPIHKKILEVNYTLNCARYHKGILSLVYGNGETFITVTFIEGTVPKKADYLKPQTRVLATLNKNIDNEFFNSSDLRIMSEAIET